MKTKGLLPALAALFSLAIVSILGRYIVLLFPGLDVPFWLGFIMFFAALESAYFSAYYLSPRTPFLVRLFELVLWLGPLYFLAGRALDVFATYSAFVLCTWLMARGYGSQLAYMERVADYLGDQGASTVTWEYESLESGDATKGSILYFWQRLLVFGALIALLAIACRSTGVRVMGGELAFLRAMGTIAVVSGLALQACAYLFRLQILWNHAKADVNPVLGQIWVRTLLTLLLCTMLVVNVAPVDYWPLTAARIAEIMRGFVFHSPDPLIEMESSGGNSQQEMEVLAFSEEIATGPWGIILAATIFAIMIVVGLLFLGIIGFIITQILGAEIERLKGLPRLAVQIYRGMQSAFGQLLHGARKIRSYLQVSSQRQRPSLPGDDLSRNPTHKRRPLLKNVRAMFRQIAKEAGRRGLYYRPSLTVWEYGEILHDKLPQGKEAVGEFFSGYQEVRYSDHNVTNSEEQRLLEVGAEIIENIENLKGEGSDATVNDK